MITRISDTNGDRPGRPQAASPATRNSAGQHRGDLLDAAAVADQRRAAAPHDEAGDEEQRGRGDAVVDHVEDRAGAALGLVKAKMPSMMKPKWLSEVRPISRSMSSWPMATSAPYTI